MHRSVIALAAALLLAMPGAAAAQATVYLVRHAERADGGAAQATMQGTAQGKMGADPDLSGAGHARAERLARMLKDAGIKAIYTTEYKRTQQTAAPVAKLLAIEPAVIPSKDTTSLVQKLKAAPAPVLIVGHSNSLPTIIKELGVAETVTIPDDEFDNLFIVVQGKAPTLVRLRYP
jgi:phosphohistidine phosphatase SixA